jgi:uncharacterized protein (DUF362 family)/NAD-dependent dihydropyrimidine dehydrogenase PreA subunit
MTSPQISLQRCDSYDDEQVLAAIRKALTPFGGMGQWVRPGMRVVLKPNLILACRPEEAATTHPAVVKAVARLVVEQGARATIVDSPGGPFNETSLRRVYSATGMSAVAQATGAALNFDFSLQNVTPRNVQILKSLSILKALAAADLVINLPKLKTHGQMVYTGAVKNLYGAIAGMTKGDYHLRLTNDAHFANALIDVFLAVSPALTIMDAVVGMEGNGPTGGKPRPLNCLLAGADAFAVDLIATQLIGLEPGQVPILREGIRRDLCPADPRAVKVTGDSPEQFAVKDFDVPAVHNRQPIEFYKRGPLGLLTAHLLRPRPVLIPGQCTGCGNCAEVCPAHVIRMLNKQPSIDLHSCIRCFCCQELCPAKALRVGHPPGGRFLLDHVAPIVARLMTWRRGH